jgi:uncharacterized protein
MPLFRYLLGFALLAFTLLSAEPTFPELTSRVVDEATLFSAAQKAELESTLENHENNTSNQVVVVTLKSLDGYDIRDYGLELGRAWGIGQKDKNNGVLLIIAPNERKVSIEVGYGLEGALPDATAKSIIDQEILPYFKEGDYFGGAKFGVDAIISAIKGEYVSYEVESSSKSFKFTDLIMPLIFLFVFIAGPVFGKKNKFDANNIIPALIFSGFVGIFTWVMFSILLLSITLSIIVFISMLFADPTVYENSSGGSYSGYSGGGGFSSGGGFSGGGGSFGGGGASGSW